MNLNGWDEKTRAKKESHKCRKDFDKVLSAYLLSQKPFKYSLSAAIMTTLFGFDKTQKLIARKYY